MDKYYCLPKEFMIIQFFKTKDFYDLILDEQKYKIIGRDDVGNFIGLSSSEEVFLLDAVNKRRVYISMSVEAFVKEIELFHKCSAIPDLANPTEDELKERESHFRALLTEIDKNACVDESTYWSCIAEEMGYGIL